MNALTIAIRPSPGATIDDHLALGRELRRCPPGITHVSVAPTGDPAADAVAIAYARSDLKDARAVVARHVDDTITTAGLAGQWRCIAPPGGPRPTGAAPEGSTGR